MLINNNALVLFQGDSITDAGRDREHKDSLGFGYATIINAWFWSSHPEMEVTFINKGIGGNRVRDLKKRWTKDCLELKPALVSIMIGINDCWRRYDENDPTSPEEFEADYRSILTQTKTHLNANIILMEPYVLPIPEDRKKWREDLDPKLQIVRKLAREYNALLVPLDSVFTRAAQWKNPEYWTPDGVHPSVAGHALIAREWLQVVKTEP